MSQTVVPGNVVYRTVGCTLAAGLALIGVAVGAALWLEDGPRPNPQAAVAWDRAVKPAAMMNLWEDGYIRPGDVAADEERRLWLGGDAPVSAARHGGWQAFVTRDHDGFRLWVRGRFFPERFVPARLARSRAHGLYPVTYLTDDE